MSNSSQTDTDGDGAGDACDTTPLGDPSLTLKNYTATDAPLEGHDWQVTVEGTALKPGSTVYGHFFTETNPTEEQTYVLGTVSSSGAFLTNTGSQCPDRPGFQYIVDFWATGTAQDGSETVISSQHVNPATEICPQ